MSKLTRLVVLATALMSVFAAFASTAGAVTWHNSGDTAFTATGGAMTYSGTGVVLGCFNGHTTGTVAATPAAGAVWPAMTLTTTYFGCGISGTDWRWQCARTFTAATQAGGVTSGTMDSTCRLLATSGGTSVPICHASGTQTATYTNPVAPSTFGRFSLQTGTFRVVDTIANCLLGHDDVMDMTPQTLIVATATGGPTPQLGPILTRTA